MSHDSRSAWVRLPNFAAPVYLLGPTPAEAMVVVEPFFPLDTPITAIQTFLGGWCADGVLVEPLEIDLVIEPGRVVPNRQVPLEAALDALSEAAAVRSGLPPVPGYDWLRGLQPEAEPVGPLVFCRKTRRLFVARGRETATPLEALPAERACSGAVIPALVSCEMRDEQPVRYYAGADGSVEGEPVHSLEQLLVDQGHVVAAATALAADDPLQAARSAAAEWVCQCEDCGEVDADDAEYKAALDRLVVAHAAPAVLTVQPHGAWSLLEAGELVGRRPAEALLASEDNAYHAWRAELTRTMLASGPTHLLADENDGRNLSEILRVLLGLGLGALEQLDQVWQATGRPHLCWDAAAVRVGWRPDAALPGTIWGLRPILRRLGLQPVAALDTVDGEPLPYPPAFSDEALITPSAVDACRHWDEPRTANVFVKTAEAGEDGQSITVLLEELGLAWEPFRTADVLHVSGEGWQAVLRPCGERDPNDGEGLPFEGTATGASLKVGEDYAGAEVRWYPRCGEAVDLHALAMLLAHALLANDERSGPAFYEAILAETAELRGSLEKLPVGQREAFVQNWAAERAEQDAPAAVWTRRNLLHARAHRAETRLDGMPAMLWQACVLWLLRMLTNVEGFSYCVDRTAAAPRSEGLLLPLLELRGLLALLDDALWARRGPAARVLETLTAEDEEE